MEIYTANVRLDAVGDKDSVAVFVRDKNGGAECALKNARLNRAEWKALVAGINEVFESEAEMEISLVICDAEVWSEEEPPS